MLSSRRRFVTCEDCGLVICRNLLRWSTVSMLPLVVGACTLFSDGSSELPERLSKTAAEIQAEDAEFPNLASVPDQPPVVSGLDERRQIKEGLIADRANAEYTTEPLQPGGATANLEGSATPSFYSIPGESDAESLASLEQETASAEPASRGDDVVPPPEQPSSEPASDAMAAGSTPPDVEPMPEVAEIPPSPASELLEPVAPPAVSSVDSPESTPASGSAGGALPPAPAVADSVPSAAEPGPTPELAEPEAEVAALPPGEEADAGTQILFGEGSADLSTTAQSELAAVADRLLQNENTRVQLLAYASGEEGASNQARRLSLSRAVAVRRFLIDQGVSSTRMDVRALGNQAEAEPADRVDIVVADR